MRFLRVLRACCSFPNRTSALAILQRDYHGGSEQRGWRWTTVGSTAVASALLVSYLADQRTNRRVLAATLTEDTPKPRPDLPTYKIDEIRKHDKKSDRVWVTYKQGVYDVTDFAENHPGGDKILLAAGGSVEPFWSIYAQHKTEQVMQILEKLRIGNVDAEDFEKFNQQDEKDPFSSDPLRHPALIVNSDKPFNAETPPSLLLDSFQTPNDLFFIRNHMPVPNIKEEDHIVLIDGEGVKHPIRLTVAQLKLQYEPHSVIAVVQCAGNRRNDMNDYKPVNGLMWTGTAISNAKWTGVRLRDILLTAGVNPNDPNIKHVQFEGADQDVSGSRYGASIHFQKALSPEVIIAYKMNDVDIPPDHGYPLRLVAPGIVGARQVKWLTAIKTSREESSSHWQKKDYRAFPPAIESGNELNYDTVPAIQEPPVQSLIVSPSPGTKVCKEDETITMSGYAWSGGGRGIIRVEVSADGGKSWVSAKLIQSPNQDLDQMWAWTFWKAEVPIPKDVTIGQKIDLVCKATDRSYNTQPETAAGLWNFRGLLHNAWHRIPVKIIE